MGNQARIADKSTALSTSTRNFPNRLGKGADVFLASAELSAVASILGRIPTPEEYHEWMGQLSTKKDSMYRYLNFNEIDQYTKSADTVDMKM
jgi:aconitate hydratase 2/2-methylisocitrate dehydratase